MDQEEFARFAVTAISTNVSDHFSRLRKVSSQNAHRPNTICEHATVDFTLLLQKHWSCILNFGKATFGSGKNGCGLKQRIAFHQMQEELAILSSQTGLYICCDMGGRRRYDTSPAVAFLFLSARTTRCSSGLSRFRRYCSANSFVWDNTNLLKRRAC